MTVVAHTKWLCRCSYIRRLSKAVCPVRIKLLDICMYSDLLGGKRRGFMKKRRGVGGGGGGGDGDGLLGERGSSGARNKAYSPRTEVTFSTLLLGTCIFLSALCWHGRFGQTLVLCVRKWVDDVIFHCQKLVLATRPLRTGWLKSRAWRNEDACNELSVSVLECDRVARSCDQGGKPPGTVKGGKMDHAADR